MTGQEIDTGAGSGLNWRLLRLLNLFRTIAAGVFTTLYMTGNATGQLGSTHPALFVWTGIVYFTFAVISSFSIRSRQPPLIVQAYLQLAADITAITLMTHASAGLVSGFASLMFVPIAVGSFLLNRRMSILFAAIAALALLGEHFYALLEGFGTGSGYTMAGIHGMIFFATAMTGGFLGQMIRESEALAKRRGVDLQNLSQLNDYIIQHFRTGVVVVDHDDRLRQMNAAAASYLGIPTLATGRRVADVSAQLATLVSTWRRNPYEQPPSFKSVASDAVIVPRCQGLGSSDQSGLLVFLEDSQIVTEEMQQMKLAALGRLTASIAHEIRNPIGAVSHANQLLAESQKLDVHDKRFVQIIRTQTERVNTIVENILE
ncbi:MAG: ATPase, partial [Gammaproteobacteria bacterium]|nr:ATPase [Gammaproteobacteria bacterium]